MVWRSRVVAPCTIRIEPVAVIPPTGIPALTLSAPALGGAREKTPIEGLTRWPDIYDPGGTVVVVATAGAVSCQIVTLHPSPSRNMGYTAHARAYEKQAIVTMARVILPSAGELTQALVTGAASSTKIKLNIYDLTNNEKQIGTETSLTCSDVVYDTYQTDSGWNDDGQGFNFKHVFSGLSLTSAGHRIRLEYFIPTDEGSIYVVSNISLDRVFKGAGVYS